MSQLEIVKNFTEYTITKVLKVFDKAVLSIPDDQLDYKPTPVNMTAKELGYHVYQVALCFTYGTEKPPYIYDYS